MRTYHAPHVRAYTGWSRESRAERMLYALTASFVTRVRCVRKCCREELRFGRRIRRADVVFGRTLNFNV